MKILITGGAGFIGINAAIRFLNKKHAVIIFDNLSKLGSEDNLKLIKGNINLSFIYGDLRSVIEVDNVIKKYQPDVIFHLGAQTAVTTSIKNPKLDFETNTLGTFNLLEAVREFSPNSKIIYASTNKVYGELKKVTEPIDESHKLDFYSPYGCSKGAADQYVNDYARIYGLKTFVLRQSCIYGEHQNGTEDQGWVAWFIKAVLEKEIITIYGDGTQRRDLLYIQDLIDLYEKILKAEQYGVYNIGGGGANVISINKIIKKLCMISEIKIKYDDWRLGDQKYFVSDNTKALICLNWEPKTSIDYGIIKLIDFFKEKL